MSSLKTLINRNQEFQAEFNSSSLPIIPKYQTVILTCADARVDPAHIFGLDLGDSVVIRNTGGRVTKAIIEEVSSLAFMVTKMTKNEGVENIFELIVLHHTQCGAERFADPALQDALKKETGIDVSSVAIKDHKKSLEDDIIRLKNAKEIPNHIIVSGCMYDVKTGIVTKEIEPTSIKSLRSNHNAQ